MDIFAVGICALCAALFGALLKKSNREYALLASAGACIVIFLSVLGELGPLVSQLRDLAESQSLPGEVLPVVLKAVGIALVGGLASRLCRDAGESALAYTVELAGKGAILAVSLPLVVRIFEYLKEIVSL